MNKRRKEKERTQVVSVWTPEQARNALPYLTSIVQSLRDTHLEIRSRELRLQRLDSRPGRPDRKLLIEQNDLKKELDQLRRDHEDTLVELEQLNISAVNPVAGLVMIPFLHGDQLAWLVFELFEAPQLTAWRYHADELGTRRKLSELPLGSGAPTLV